MVNVGKSTSPMDPMGFPKRLNVDLGQVFGPCFAAIWSHDFVAGRRPGWTLKMTALYRRSESTGNLRSEIGFLLVSTWNPKQPFINGCLVISNHFLYKDWESSN